MLSTYECLNRQKYIYHRGKGQARKFSRPPQISYYGKNIYHDLHETFVPKVLSFDTQSRSIAVVGMSLGGNTKLMPALTLLFNHDGFVIGMKLEDRNLRKVAIRFFEGFAE